MSFYRFLLIFTYLTRATTLIFILTNPFLGVLNSFWHWITLFVYKLCHTCFQNRKQNSTHACMAHVVIFPNHSNVSLHELKSKQYKVYKIQSFVFLQLPKFQKLSILCKYHLKLTLCTSFPEQVIRVSQNSIWDGKLLLQFQLNFLKLFLTLYIKWP